MGLQGVIKDAFPSLRDRATAKLMEVFIHDGLEEYKDLEKVFIEKNIPFDKDFIRQRIRKITEDKKG